MDELDKGNISTVAGKHEDYLKNEDELKNKDKLKNKDSLKLSIKKLHLSNFFPVLVLMTHMLPLSSSSTSMTS